MRDAAQAGLDEALIETLAETTAALAQMDLEALLALETRAEAMLRALGGGSAVAVPVRASSELLKRQMVLEQLLVATAGNLRVAAGVGAGGAGSAGRGSAWER